MALTPRQSCCWNAGIFHRMGRLYFSAASEIDEILFAPHYYSLSLLPFTPLLFFGNKDSSQTTQLLKPTSFDFPKRVAPGIKKIWNMELS
jgi:hypothetical protein